MTLEELDQALEKTGLDLTNPPDMDARNKILYLHGKSIIDSKEERCMHCWHGQNNRCFNNCMFHNLPEDPVEVSKKYLLSQNNIQLVPFLCQYMIPVYEEVTGRKNIMEKMALEFKKLIKLGKKRN